MVKVFSRLTIRYASLSLYQPKTRILKDTVCFAPLFSLMAVSYLLIVSSSLAFLAPPVLPHAYTHTHLTLLDNYHCAWQLRNLVTLHLHFDGLQQKNSPVQLQSLCSLGHGFLDYWQCSGPAPALQHLQKLWRVACTYQGHNLSTLHSIKIIINLVKCYSIYQAFSWWVHEREWFLPNADASELATVVIGANLTQHAYDAHAAQTVKVSYFTFL